MLDRSGIPRRGFRGRKTRFFEVFCRRNALEANFVRRLRNTGRSSKNQGSTPSRERPTTTKTRFEAVFDRTWCFERLSSAFSRAPGAPRASPEAVFDARRPLLEGPAASQDGLRGDFSRPGTVPRAFRSVPETHLHVQNYPKALRHRFFVLFRRLFADFASISSCDFRTFL